MRFMGVHITIVSIFVVHNIGFAFETGDVGCLNEV